MRKKKIIIAAIFFCLALTACNNKMRSPELDQPTALEAERAQKQKEQAARDAAAALDAARPQEMTIVNKTFFVNSYEKFEFQLPPHAKNPKLHGTFHSIPSNRRKSASGPGDGEKLSVMLMTESEYKDYSTRRVEQAVVSWTNVSQEVVDHDLSVTGDQPETYYLVFRPSASSMNTVLVSANFSISYRK